MLILQARNWNRPHSIATDIKKAKQDLGAMSRSDFSQLLCSKSASQRREHDNNYNHFTELSKLHSKIVLCKKEMKMGSFQKSCFWYFHRPLPVGSGTFAQSRTYWSASLWNTRWAQAWWVTTAPGNTLKKVWKYKNKQKQKIQNTYWATSFWWNIR